MATHPAADVMVFVKEFLRSPRRTASVVPSGRALAGQMILPIPERGDPVVVELGPGTGSFTGAICRRLAGRGRHLAIELNPVMVKQLALRYPEVEVIQADAADLAKIMADRDVPQADVVVSGLPWVLPPERGTNTVLSAVARSLRDDGVFVQFTYALTRVSPIATQRLTHLRTKFEEVVVGRTVWGNLPPAVVYFARRPRRLLWSTVNQ